MDRPTALIVEDNEHNIEMYSILMHIQKYTPTGIHDGLEAINWLKDNDAPEIILLDVNMPHADGRQVYQYIRGEAKFHQTCVIIVTANSYMADLMRTMLHRGDYVLPKPFPLSELQTLVRNVRKSSV